MYVGAPPFCWPVVVVGEFIQCPSTDLSMRMPSSHQRTQSSQTRPRTMLLRFIREQRTHATHAVFPFLLICPSSSAPPLLLLLLLLVSFHIPTPDNHEELFPTASSSLTNTLETLETASVSLVYSSALMIKTKKETAETTVETVSYSSRLFSRFSTHPLALFNPLSLVAFVFHRVFTTTSLMLDSPTLSVYILCTLFMWPIFHRFFFFFLFLFTLSQHFFIGFFANHPPGVFPKPLPLVQAHFFL